MDLMVVQNSSIEDYCLITNEGKPPMDKS